MEDLLPANGKEVVADVEIHKVGSEHTQKLGAAEAAMHNKGEDEAAVEYFPSLAVVGLGKRIFEADGAVLLKGNCKNLCSCHPEN